MADCRGSDNGINSEIISKTLKCIQALSPQPSFAVMPGDLIYGATTYAETNDQLQYFKDTITQYYPIDFFYPGYGNHEGSAGEDGEKAFADVFLELEANFLKGYDKTVYYFDRDRTRFYMLNSYHYDEQAMVSDNQLKWIQTTQNSDIRSTFYFIHHPPYPTGDHVGSSLDLYPLQRDKLWETIDRSASPMVFCGHEHTYTRRHIDSDFDETVENQDFHFNRLVYQVTTGTFGASIYTAFNDKKNVDVPPTSVFNYVVVDVIKDKTLVTAFDLDGKVIDQFEQKIP